MAAKNFKLNQIVAIEKDVKSRAESAVTELFQVAKKEGLWNGVAKAYEPKDESGEQFPPERQRVQFSAPEVLSEMAKHWGEVMDLTLVKDLGNCEAKADLEIDGVTVAKGVPATTLLALEKKCVALKEFISAIPVLDESEDWELDPNTGLYRTKVPSKTHRTKKVNKVLTMAPATDKHPAQCQTYTEDEIIGWWTGNKFSGALPTPRKKELLERVVKLTKAVKSAREQANAQECGHAVMGAALFSWLLK